MKKIDKFVIGIQEKFYKEREEAGFIHLDFHDLAKVFATGNFPA